MYVNIDLECVRIIYAGVVCIWLKNFYTAAWSSLLPTLPHPPPSSNPLTVPVCAHIVITMLSLVTCRGHAQHWGPHPHPPCFYIFKTPHGVRCPTISFYCTGACTSMPYRCTGTCPTLSHDALHHNIYCTGTCPTMTYDALHHSIYCAGTCPTLT